MPNISVALVSPRTLAIAVVLALIAAVGMAPRADARVNVPFAAFETNVGEAQFAGFCDDELTVVKLVGTGTGTGTQIGRYEIHFTECFDVASLDFTVDFTITAANGDALVGEYAGHVLSPDAYVADGQFAGGTGRFDGAGGEFHISATVDDSGYEALWSGWISNPGHRGGR